MDSTSSVSTRRVIRVAEPDSDWPSGPSPQRRSPMPPDGSPLWRSWLARFTELDRALREIDARERASWRDAPRTGNPAETSRIHIRFLAPWMALADTFPAAVCASPLTAAQCQAMQAYLDLRTTYYRCLMKRFLVPSDVALAQLAEAEARLDAAVAKRPL